MEKLPAYANLEAMLTDYAAALTAQPWLGRFPAALNDMVVFVRHNQFFISDNAGKYIPLACEEKTGWELLARFGGQPCTIFGEWENSRFSPLSVLDTGVLITLGGSGDAAKGNASK